jgi:hypothetical protein
MLEFRSMLSRRRHQRNQRDQRNSRFVVFKQQEDRNG